MKTKITFVDQTTNKIITNVKILKTNSEDTNKSKEFTNTLPSVKTEDGIIIITDKATKKSYKYQLWVDLLVDIRIHVYSINLEKKEMKYKYPITPYETKTDPLKDEDIKLISTYYNKTKIKGLIEGLKTKKGKSLLLELLEIN